MALRPSGAEGVTEQGSQGGWGNTGPSAVRVWVTAARAGSADPTPGRQALGGQRCRRTSAPLPGAAADVRAYPPLESPLLEHRVRGKARSRHQSPGAPGPGPAGTSTPGSVEGPGTAHGHGPPPRPHTPLAQDLGFSTRSLQKAADDRRKRNRPCARRETPGVGAIRVTASQPRPSNLSLTSGVTSTGPPSSSFLVSSSS